MYAATVNGRHLTFEAYGVWRKNMVMRDHQTGTLWQHATGEAVTGALKGARLEILPAWETTWGELRQSHPNARYALEPQKFGGVIPKKILMRMLSITEYASLLGLSQPDENLPAHAVVIGVARRGEARAYPLAVLRELGTIQDRLGDETLRLEYFPAGDRVQVSASNGASLPYERQWWLGWSEFHPRSTVYTLEERERSQGK